MQLRAEKVPHLAVYPSFMRARDYARYYIELTAGKICICHFKTRTGSDTNSIC